MSGKQESHERRKNRRVRYAPFDRSVPIDWGDPDELFKGDPFVNFRVEHRVLMVKTESVFGKLRVGEHRMDLTADAVCEALELVERDKDANTVTGKVVFVLGQDMFPHVTMNWDHTPIEEIFPDWPEGVEFPEGSIVAAITNPKAKRLAVHIEDVYRERGGQPGYRRPKSEQGGWTSASERDRKTPGIKT